ncbi:MAG TPA: hypothetical protein VHC19_20315 [Pirellulales bacterium]|nr:hypothetical protein [Pirellulales bacterium]
MVVPNVCRSELTQLPARRAAGRVKAVLWLLLWLSLTPLVVGCGGCVSDDGLTEKEREAKREELRNKEKPKKDFEFIAFSTQPGTLENEDRREVHMKPGHWTSAVLETRANNFDFRGELASEVYDKQQQPVDLDQMPFRLSTTRPAIMPKGQRRFLEFSLFAPAEARGRWAQTRLLNGAGGRMLVGESHAILPMPAHQYYFVVLALNPDSYRFLQRLDSVTAPHSLLTDLSKSWHYRIVAPQISKSVAPLPSSALSWTSVAYVLWDDLSPKKLSLAQQQALVDWLHWGGQLIVSGPDSLGTLKGSFLEPYLPAAGGDAWELDTDALGDMNAAWDQGDLPLKVVRHWTGQKLKPTRQAIALAASGGEPLVVEQRVGRGRVVVTAFRLSQRELRNWPSFDGFFNGCLLRRPARSFRYVAQDDMLQVGWIERPGAHHDPRTISQVRYFTRDALAPPDMFKQEFEGRKYQPYVEQEPEFPPGMPGGYAPMPQLEDPPDGPGVAGWSDFSAASNLAFSALREAAGIVVPDASFVVKILAVYVLVLVPLNWLVFRLAGRVEWAWGAAPFIAIGAAIAVVYLAQLDIGFARSKTELAVLEVQGDYDRAHLTRYLALYSSLGTSYDLRFDDASAVALPFASGQKMLIGQGRTTVEYRRARKATGDKDDAEISLVSLEGLEISSNTTGMVHSEEMLQLAGGLAWEHLGGQRYKVSNNTGLELQGAGVVSGESAAWIGTLGPGAAHTVEMKPWPKDEQKLWNKEWNQSPITAESPPDEGMHLRKLMSLARLDVPDDEFRLLAWTDEELPGLSVAPRASQSRQLALVVAHLNYGIKPAPQQDNGSRRLALKAAGKSLWEGLLDDEEGDGGAAE